MTKFNVTYEAPSIHDGAACLAVSYPEGSGSVLPLSPTATVQRGEGEVTQRIYLNPDNITEVLEAAWVIVRFILAIIAASK